MIEQALFGAGVIVLVGGGYLYATGGADFSVGIRSSSNDDSNDDVDTGDGTATAQELYESIEDDESEQEAYVEADVDGDGDTDVEATYTDDGETRVSVVDDRPLEELTGVGTTRAAKLRSAGFDVAQDLIDASDEDILGVHGIGENVLEEIKEDL